MHEDVRLIYLFVCFVNLFIFIFSGKKISKAKSNKEYWKAAILPILSFSVYMGLRFGRLVDYNLYFFRYQEIGRGINEDDYEFLFQYLCYFLFQLKVPYYIFIYLCSLSIIIICFKFIKKNKEAGIYISLILLSALTPVEQLVRWFLAMNFLILGVIELEKKQYVKFFIWAAISIFIHIGYLLLTVLIFAVSFYKKPFFNSKIAILLLFLTTFVLDVSILHLFDNYIQILSINDRTQNYAENYSNMINGDFGRLGIRALDISNKIRIFLAYSFPLYQITKLVKANKISLTQTNICFLTLILIPLFSQLEILSRYTASLYLLSVIPIGYSYYASFKSYKTNSPLKNAMTIISLCAILYPLIFFTFLGRQNWYQMLFIWDANGKEYLNIEYFL